MSVKINASTSSGLVVDSDLTGSLKLQTGGNDALTVDSSQVVNFTKQFQIAGVLPPAFSASKQGGNQSITQGTWTKITYNTEEFDTNNNFASSTFTPTVAGYYVLTANLETQDFTGYAQMMFYKNGVYYTRAGTTNCISQGAVPTGSVVLYMNGSTDYAEVYIYVSASGVSVVGDSNFATRFTGAMVRSA